MEKVYGSSTRQDSLTKVGRSYYLYYGFGKDSEDAEHGYNYRHKFNHKPSREEITEQVLAAIDLETRERITKGMVYNGYKVNLSVENQLNYSMFQSMESYPIIIKVGDSDGVDVAISFDEDEFATFYAAVKEHIKESLQDCWNEKTTLDLSCYFI